MSHSYISSHTVTFQGIFSPQDENPPNPDRNDSTVSQADESSTETEHLENMTQEYEKSEKRRPLISSEKLQNVTQNLIWNFYITEKFDQATEEIFLPEKVDGLEINKVNLKSGEKFPTVQNIVMSDFKIHKNFFLKTKRLLVFF